MAMILTLFFGVIGWLLAAAFLYWGVRLVKERGTFAGMLVITLAGSVVETVLSLFGWPFIGAILGWITVLVLLKKFTTVENIWPTAVLVTGVAWLLGQIVLVLLLHLWQLIRGAY